MARIDNVSLSASRSPDRLKYMAGKFVEWKDRGRIPQDCSLETMWRNSRVLPMRTDYAQSVAWVFGTDIKRLDIRATPIGAHFSLIFICVDGEVIELCTYRTIRSLNHIHLAWLARRPIRRDEAEMLRQMSITKFMSWQQGGLIRGKLTPRIIGKCRLGVAK